MDLNFSVTVYIECENEIIEKILDVTPDDLVSTNCTERQMGEEIEYTFEVDFHCQECKKDYRATIEMWEYPIGVWNNGPDVEIEEC